jgi:Bacterial Ig domain
MKKLLPLLLAVSFLAAPAMASQIRVPVNTNTSSLALTLCATPSGLGTACDTDTKSLTGFITVALDDNGMPTQIALRNYDLRAQGNFNLNLSWVFGLARLDAVATGLQVYHARPGVSNAPVPIVANACTFTNVPMRTSGNANYVINQLACSSIGGAFPCSSNINLADLGENSLTALTGTVQVVNGILSIDFDFIFEQPIDETNPTLGVFSGYGTVRGSTPVSLDLVPRGSDWKYLDDGSDQGTAWVQPPPAYDDSLWPLGLAQLGYGDGDEQTVVSFGPSAANKRITTYFRHAFFVPDAFIYTNLALRVLYDDGVIVYLNGAEIHRANLPSDPFPSYLTVASSAASTATENAFFAAPPIDPALLTSGWNTLAVGIHQSGPESSDISFDLEMLGNGSFPIAPPSVAILSPTNNTVFNGSAFSFQITATDSDGVITRVELFEGANKIGESTAVGPNYSISWNSSCPGPFNFTARATDNDGLVGVSLPVVVTRTPVSLVAPGSTWRFLDDGSNPPTAWRSNGFNEASWTLGTGQFGWRWR